MQLSLPWILSRKRLIAALIADGILFAFLYYALYGWRFGVWPGPSPRLALLLSIWCLTSYVGRYVSGAERRSESDAGILLVSADRYRHCSASNAWHHSASYLALTKTLFRPHFGIF